MTCGKDLLGFVYTVKPKKNTDELVIFFTQLHPNMPERVMQLKRTGRNGITFKGALKEIQLHTKLNEFEMQMQRLDSKRKFQDMQTKLSSSSHCHWMR